MHLRLKLLQDSVLNRLQITEKLCSLRALKLLKVGYYLTLSKFAQQ